MNAVAAQIHLSIGAVDIKFTRGGLLEIQAMLTEAVEQMKPGSTENRRSHTYSDGYPANYTSTEHRRKGASRLPDETPRANLIRYKGLRSLALNKPKGK